MSEARLSVRRLEELAMNAHPALQTHVCDGWVLRVARGYTNRSNSVHPLYPGELPLATKVELCETFYRERGLPAVFKLTPDNPPDLDKLLEGRGYRVVTPTDVMTRPLPLSAGEGRRTQVADAVDERWLEAFYTLGGIRDADDAQTAAAIKGLIAAPVLSGLIPGETGPAACGLCAVEDGCAGLFDIAVHPAWRRKGLGRDLCASLLGRAAQLGAHTAYLQVTASNGPAGELYRRMGFRTVYRYWYRVREHVGPQNPDSAAEAPS